MMKNHELTFGQSDRSIRSSLQVAELDLEDPRCEYFYDGPHLSATQSFPLHIFGKRNYIQYFHYQSPLKM